MAEMPIEPEFGRHIAPITGSSEQDLQEVEALPPDAEFLENEDGSVTVVTGDAGPDQDDEFFDNLAEGVIDDSELNHVATTLLDLIERDKEARKKRDEQYAEGIKRTGLGNEAPGGASFEGASKAVHPLLAEGCIDFGARAVKELFPPSGPVKTHIIGDATTDQLEKADRKKTFMNYQLTGSGKLCILEYRAELEQLLSQLPLGGSQYLKIWHNDSVMRHQAEFVPIDDVFLPYSAVSFTTSARVTHRQMITRAEFERRVESGLYRDINFTDPSVFVDQSAASKANEAVEGATDEMSYNEDGLRQIYEIYADWKFVDDRFANERTASYIITIDDSTRKVLSVYRNWEEDDESMTKLEWLVDFNFIPWRGAYAVGLPHLIGSLSGALTGALRALLDSAHINNAATMLKLKGARTSGQNVQVEVTEVCEIEGPTGIDDIRKLAMPMPFNPPSTVLFQLLDWIVNQAKGVVQTAEESIANASANTPVGTTLALIEQGSQVFSAIHARLHDSQRRCLAIIHRLNGRYLNDKEVVEELGNLVVSRQDFVGPMDIQPVSDPNIFSDAQRYAQLQAAMQLADKYPNLYKLDKLNERALRLIKLPDFEEVLNIQEEPQQTDPVTENTLAASGERPLKVYPDQDHLGHLTAHVMFMTSPIFCANPIMANPTLPTLIQHCREHLLAEYAKQAKAALAAGIEISPTPEDAAKFSGVLADQELAKKLGDIMQHLSQVAQQQTQLIPPQPPADPNAAVNLQIGMAEIQRKKDATQQDIQLKTELQQLKNEQEQQAAAQQAQLEQVREEARAQADAAAQQLEHERQQSQAAIDAAIQLIRDENDNHTKVLVAQMQATHQAVSDNNSAQQAQLQTMLEQLMNQPSFMQRVLQRFGINQPAAQQAQPPQGPEQQ